MKFSFVNKKMFQAVFEGKSDDFISLLRYMEWWIREGYDKLETSPFCPSALWKEWANQTFVGFSSSKMILQSGHNFPSSFQIIPSHQKTFFSMKNFISYMRVNNFIQNKDRIFRSFKRIYPSARVTKEHESWYHLNPNPYFRYFEAFLLKESDIGPRWMLEVGAGACVNIAFYRSLFKDLRVVVIDLPEAIPVGYAFLKCVFPSLKICLPNDLGINYNENDYDVIFMLPYQTDKIARNRFDLAMNMSSFQEMDTKVIGNYMLLIAECLKKEGVFISVNLEQSRYIPDNNLKYYNFSAFNNKPTIKTADFANIHARSFRGNVCFVEVRKK